MGRTHITTCEPRGNADTKSDFSSRPTSSTMSRICRYSQTFLVAFRCHGDRGRRKLQPGPETALLSGPSLRQEEQHPHHGRGHGVHRHGNGQCVCEDRSEELIRERGDRRALCVARHAAAGYFHPLSWKQGRNLEVHSRREVF